MRNWLLGLWLLACVASPPAQSMTVFEETLTCPIGGEEFETRSVGSGTAFGQNLDRRQLGAIASPWPIAKCPGNGFVLFREEFEPAELELLAAVVASPEYQAAQKLETNYYLAAILASKLGATPVQLANWSLKATWEVEGDARYPRYAAEALARIESLLATDTSLEADDRHGWEQLAGELERRLGRFEPARRRLEDLMPRIVGSDLEPLVRQELRLIQARDIRTHPVEPPAE